MISSTNPGCFLNRGSTFSPNGSANIVVHAIAPDAGAGALSSGTLVAKVAADAAGDLNYADNSLTQAVAISNWRLAMGNPGLSDAAPLVVTITANGPSWSNQAVLTGTVDNGGATTLNFIPTPGVVGSKTGDHRLRARDRAEQLPGDGFDRRQHDAERVVSGAGDRAIAGWRYRDGAAPGDDSRASEQHFVGGAQLRARTHLHAQRRELRCWNGTCHAYPGERRIDRALHRNRGAFLHTEPGDGCDLPGHGRYRGHGWDQHHDYAAAGKGAALFRRAPAPVYGFRRAALAPAAVPNWN